MCLHSLGNKPPKNEAILGIAHLHKPLYLSEHAELVSRDPQRVLSSLSASPGSDLRQSGVRRAAPTLLPTQLSIEWFYGSIVQTFAHVASGAGGPAATQTPVLVFGCRVHALGHAY